MDADLGPVLRGLADAAEFARTYRFQLTDEYLALIERIEARRKTSLALTRVVAGAAA